MTLNKNENSKPFPQVFFSSLCWHPRSTTPPTAGSSGAVESAVPSVDFFLALPVSWGVSFPLGFCLLLLSKVFPLKHKHCHNVIIVHRVPAGERTNSHRPPHKVQRSAPAWCCLSSSDANTRPWIEVRAQTAAAEAWILRPLLISHPSPFLPPALRSPADRTPGSQEAS